MEWQTQMINLSVDFISILDFISLTFFLFLFLKNNYSSY